MLRLDWNLVFTIMNLVVFYLLMKKLLIGPVIAIMDQRQALIESQLSHARDTEAQAEDLKQQFASKLSGSEAEADRIIEEARSRAKSEYDRIVGEAQDQAGRIMDNAHKTAGMEQEKALREVEGQIAGLVIAAAAKVVSGESGEDSNLALYDKYIEKAGESYDANGH